MYNDICPLHLIHPLVLLGQLLKSSYSHSNNLRSKEAAKTIKNPGDSDPWPGSTAGDGPLALLYSDHCSLQVAPAALKDRLNAEDKFHCTFTV